MLDNITIIDGEGRGRSELVIEAKEQMTRTDGRVVVKTANSSDAGNLWVRSFGIKGRNYEPTELRPSSEISSRTPDTVRSSDEIDGVEYGVVFEPKEGER